MAKFLRFVGLIALVTTVGFMLYSINHSLRVEAQQLDRVDTIVKEIQDQLQVVKVSDLPGDFPQSFTDHLGDTWTPTEITPLALDGEGRGTFRIESGEKFFINAAGQVFRLGD